MSDAAPSEYSCITTFAPGNGSPVWASTTTPFIIPLSAANSITGKIRKSAIIKIRLLVFLFIVFVLFVKFLIFNKQV